MTTINADIRELQKWLNEEPNRPLNKAALARVLHHIEGASVVGEIVTDCDGEIVLCDEVSWSNGMPSPGTKLYVIPSRT